MSHQTSEKRFADLRHRAEQMLSGKSQEQRETDGQDLLSLLQEVEVQRIELELQNDELRQANQELFESRNKHIELLEFAPVAIVFIDTNGLIQHCNKAAFQLLAPPSSYKSLAGIGFSRLVHAEDRNTYFSYLNHLLNFREWIREAKKWSI